MQSRRGGASDLPHSFSSSPANHSRIATPVTGVGVRLGCLGQLNDYVTLAATWQSQAHMGRLSKYSGLFAYGGAFDIPESYGLGIAVHPAQAWTIGVDWQRILYADVPSVGDPIDSLFAGVPLRGGYALSDVVTLRAGVSESQ